MNPVEDGTHDEVDPSTIPRQCTAHSSRTRDRCRRSAIHGSNVCYHHGGAAPQVQKKARERLLEMVDPALHELSLLIVEADTDTAKLRAIENVLDRAGFAKSTNLNVKGQLDLESVRSFLSENDED